MNEDAVKLVTFVRRYSDLVSEGGLRWQIFNREENGIERCGAVLKGRDGRWYVSPSRYREWLSGVTT